MSTPALLDPRAFQPIAEAYELTPLDVMLDAEVVHGMPGSGLGPLLWVCHRYGWQVSAAVAYLAAIRRALAGQKGRVRWEPYPRRTVV